MCDTFINFNTLCYYILLLYYQWTVICCNYINSRVMPERLFIKRTLHWKQWMKRWPWPLQINGERFIATCCVHCDPLCVNVFTIGYPGRKKILHIKLLWTYLFRQDKSHLILLYVYIWQMFITNVHHKHCYSVWGDEQHWKIIFTKWISSIYCDGNINRKHVGVIWSKISFLLS